MNEQVKYFVLILLLLFICIGLFGNSLNCIILSRKQIRKKPIYRSLLYESIFSLLTLIICGLDVLLSSTHLFEIRVYSQTACRLHTFLSYFLTQADSSIICLINIQMVLSFYLNNPMKILFNNKRRTIFNKWPLLNNFYLEAILILVIIIYFILNSHFLISLSLRSLDIDYFSSVILKNANQTVKMFNDTFEPKIGSIQQYLESNAKICYPRFQTKYEIFLTDYWFWIDSSLYSILPNIVIIVAFFLLRFKTKQIIRQFSSFLINSRENASFDRILLFDRKFSRMKNLSSMLNSSNVYFMIFSIPYFIAIQYQKKESNTKALSKYLFILNILSYSNSAFNFIFYAIFSDGYKREILKIFRNRSRYNEPKNQIEQHELTSNIKQTSRQTSNCNAKTSIYLSVPEFLPSFKHRKNAIVRETCSVVHDS
jgi:hypothetical protein